MIGIIVAMEIELSALENKMVDIISYNEINQIKFIQGRFSNKNCFMFKWNWKNKSCYSVWCFTKQLSS